jgi:hypothetical protein
MQVTALLGMNGVCIHSCFRVRRFRSVTQSHELMDRILRLKNKLKVKASSKELQ